MTSDILLEATNLGVLNLLLLMVMLILLVATIIVLAQAKASLKSRLTFQITSADPAVASLVAEVQEIRKDIRSQTTRPAESDKSAGHSLQVKELEDQLRDATSSLKDMQTHLDDSAEQITTLRAAAASEANRLQSTLDEAQRALQVALLSGESASKRPQPILSSEPHAVKTRISNSVSDALGPFDVEDKIWSVEEDTSLLMDYHNSLSVESSAVSLALDARQIAKRLVILLMSPAGEVNVPDAKNHGKKYTKAHSEAILQGWLDGKRLPALARDFGRDQLGIGWKLLSHEAHPVQFDLVDIPEIVSAAHE